MVRPAASYFALSYATLTTSVTWPASRSSADFDVSVNELLDRGSGCWGHEKAGQLDNARWSW